MGRLLVAGVSLSMPNRPVRDVVCRSPLLALAGLGSAAVSAPSAFLLFRTVRRGLAGSPWDERLVVTGRRRTPSMTWFSVSRNLRAVVLSRAVLPGLIRTVSASRFRVLSVSRFSALSLAYLTARSLEPPSRTSSRGPTLGGRVTIAPLWPLR